MRVVVTGSNGLIGAACCRVLDNAGIEVVGFDNNDRAKFFGPAATTRPIGEALKRELLDFKLSDTDISDWNDVSHAMEVYRPDAVIHCAAQPSHDWAAKDVFRDFAVNATGTLNMLEAFRKHGKGGAFVHLSTNKVYGDVPNYLEYDEGETRYTPSDPMLAEHGFDETTSVDNTKHSLFGCSKLAGDIYAQEYGKYYGMPTVIFRGGCLTGGGHAGAELHGFLSYLFKAGVSGTPYKVFGYKGKQVRDNIHAVDVARAALACLSKPVAYSPGEVFNIGGELERSCSVLEAIDACSKRTGKHFDYTLVDDARIGDHKWWSSDMTKFKTMFPHWSHSYTLNDIYDDIYESALRAQS